MIKLLRNLLLAAAVCCAFASCDKEDMKPSEMILGAWKPAATEGWSIDTDGATVNRWAWKPGDSGAITRYMLEWMTLCKGGTGESNSGDLNWQQDEDALVVKFGSVSSGSLIVMEFNIVKLSAQTLVLEMALTDPSSGTKHCERVTYGKK